MSLFLRMVDSDVILWLQKCFYEIKYYFNIFVKRIILISNFLIR